MPTVFVGRLLSLSGVIGAPVRRGGRGGQEGRRVDAAAAGCRGGRGAAQAVPMATSPESWGGGCSAMTRARGALPRQGRGPLLGARGPEPGAGEHTQRDHGVALGPKAERCAMDMIMMMP